MVRRLIISNSISNDFNRFDFPHFIQRFQHKITEFSRIIMDALLPGRKIDVEVVRNDFKGDVGSSIVMRDGE